MPLSPCCVNFQGDLSRLPVAANCTRGLANGSGLPSSRVKQRLGVERVDVRRPALHEQEDDPLGPRRKMRRLGGERIGRRLLGARFVGQQRGQGQRAEADGRLAQQSAARDSGSDGDRRCCVIGRR